MHVHARGIKIVRGEIVLLLRMNPPSLLDFSILIRTVELASESLYNPNRIFSRNLDTAESQIMERGRKDAKDAKKRMRRKERKATRFTYLNQQETLVKQKRRRRK
ncbi:hypothetical protein VNO77_15910 [Canavalia gladiata]|uniref:Uncharacterized protein n=1 Tax=Canavalia gladiata TaxID=3824 RepID=A0AAN9M375_CANGL